MIVQRQLLFLELNEVNFEFIEAYVEQGELPRLGKLIARHGYSTTTSETQYDHLEPWIQWVTAHTGLSFDQHKVFRLGDIVDHDIPQIWERLEEQGLRVGAISPMNAKFRLKNPAFFVPDPWTDTEVFAEPNDKRFFAAISNMVNENASGETNLRLVKDFVLGAMRNAAVGHYPAYLRMLAAARSKSWYRAMFLDQLLADMFVRLFAKERPQFASLFLNAAAHIQHHYMFNSRALDQTGRNPEWYIAPDDDPVLDVYRLYDRAVGAIMNRFPKARIMLATGLHQVPHHSTTFYWRLKNHADFLRRFDVEFEQVHPRMSRDFLVTCRDSSAAVVAQRQLEALKADDGVTLFTVDNRGSDLFVMLTYPNDISNSRAAVLGDRRVQALREHVSFVAIKNGAHHGTGYFLDTGVELQNADPTFALASVPDRIERALIPA